MVGNRSHRDSRTLFGRDYDDLFAYSTVKIARIRDRRLGILHYLFMVCTIGYIVGYSVIYQQHYLQTEAPFGSVRATLQEPTNFTAAQGLPYCTQNQNSTEHNGVVHQNYDCIYMRGFDAQYAAGSRNSLFATTRIKDSIYSPPPAHCTDPPRSPECLVPNVTSTRYYVADIERFTVYFEHEVYGQQTGSIAKNGDLNGKVLYGDNSRVDLDPPRTGDVFTLGDVMSWADLNSLEVSSDLAGSTDTLRYDGATIVIIITYENRRSFAVSSQLKYTYSAVYIGGLDVLAAEPSYVNEKNQTVQRARHGVALLFLIAGSVGVFSFAALLTALVAGIVLLGVSTTIVDLLMQYVMPERKEYSALKYDVSEDFSAKNKYVNIRPHE